MAAAPAIRKHRAVPERGGHVSETATTWESDRTRSVVGSGESSRSRSDLTSLSESAAWLDSGSIEFLPTCLYLSYYTDAAGFRHRHQQRALNRCREP